jgi:hypothetical protein
MVCVWPGAEIVVGKRILVVVGGYRGDSVVSGPAGALLHAVRTSKIKLSVITLTEFHITCYDLRIFPRNVFLM